jgi:hypothetical protein
MCRTKTPSTRVRWGGLYAIVLSTSVVTFAVAIASMPPSLRVGTTAVVFVAGGIGIMRYLAVQRVALDLSDWCDCAASRVTIRIVASHDGTRLPRESEKAVDERGYADATSAR